MYHRFHVCPPEPTKSYGRPRRGSSGSLTGLWAFLGVAAFLFILPILSAILLSAFVLRYWGASASEKNLVRSTGKKPFWFHARQYAGSKNSWVGNPLFWR